MEREISIKLTLKFSVKDYCIKLLIQLLTWHIFARLTDDSEFNLELPFHVLMIEALHNIMLILDVQLLSDFISLEEWRRRRRLLIEMDAHLIQHLNGSSSHTKKREKERSEMCYILSITISFP